MVDYRERVPDNNAGAIKAALDARQVKMWTSLPGIVQTVDLNKLTVTVQPAIQSLVGKPDGTRVPTNLPLLPDVPIVTPHGGGYSLTFPHAPNDEILTVFSSRCIDNWWANGGVQPQFENRVHDLSDGFALPGPFSQKTKIGGVSTSTVQLRSDDGTLFVEVDLPNKRVHLVSNGITLSLDSAAGEVIVTAPTVKINGNLDVSGEIRRGVGTGDQVTLGAHRHGTGGTSASSTVPPTPGT
jgi:phage baseplate assembly protein gpV